MHDCLSGVLFFTWEGCGNLCVACVACHGCFNCLNMCVCVCARTDGMGESHGYYVI